MSDIPTRFINALFGKRTQVEGIHSFSQWRFYIVVLLYFGSLICLARDPFFLHHGNFMFSRQNVITVFLAYIIGASFCWEHPVFGKCSGANLLLQCLMLLPLSLFIARILVQPTPISQTYFAQGIDAVIKATRQYLFDFDRIIPTWLQQIFINWKLSLFALIVVSVLSLNKLQWRISAVVSLLVIPFAITVSEGGELRWLTAGVILLVSGLTLQFCRYDRIIYYENIARRLSNEGGDQLAIGLITRIMVQLEDRKSLTEKNLLVLTRDEYQKTGEYTDAEYRMIATEILQQMIYKYNFIAMRNDIKGIVAEPNKSLWRNDHLLTGITVVPRMIIISVLMIGWILSPIDIIPDSTPLIGALDDVSVALLSSFVLKHTFTDLSQTDA